MEREQGLVGNWEYHKNRYHCNVKLMTACRTNLMSDQQLRLVSTSPIKKVKNNFLKIGGENKQVR